jgi:hypothetical protein
MTLLLPFANEATEVHTRILRLSLGVDESRAYWAHVDPRVPLAERPPIAAAEGWFPGKSEACIRYLLAACAERYDAFPDGLEALRRWRSIDDGASRVVAHVHLMLSDPLYRAFAGELLVARRRAGEPLDRAAVEAWIEERTPGRWAGVTARQAAQKLMASATEAGLRAEDAAAVPDLALVYVLYLLRGIRFAGAPLDNPYLDSLGLHGELLVERLATMGAFGVRLKGPGEVVFTDPDVVAWSRHTFAPVIGAARR